jgi:DNA-directed RNA polymerase beta subunit
MLLSSSLQLHVPHTPLSLLKTQKTIKPKKQGTEKVILIQEQLSKNRIIIDLDAAGEPAASVTSSTHERKSKTNVGTKGGRIYLRHNAFTDDVNIVVALKAMGADSDQEAVALIGSEEPLQAALLPTLQEASALGVSTAAQALEHVASKLAQRGPPGRAFAERRRKSKVDEARDVLASVVLCHVPAPRHDFGAKRLYLASMARRLIAAMLDRSLLDDRDHYGNKRLELAGALCEFVVVCVCVCCFSSQNHNKHIHPPKKPKTIKKAASWPYCSRTCSSASTPTSSARPTSR